MPIVTIFPANIHPARKANLAINRRRFRMIRLQPSVRTYAHFDKLSFRDNFEFNLATSDKQTVERIMTKLFIHDFNKSMEMTEPFKTGLKERISEFIAEQL